MMPKLLACSSVTNRLRCEARAERRVSGGKVSLDERRASGWSWPHRIASHLNQRGSQSSTTIRPRNFSLSQGRPTGSSGGALRTNARYPGFIARPA